MTSELFILAFALLLFFYWFRYNCLTILRAARADDRARRVVAANQLQFLEVVQELEKAPSPERLEKLNRCLIRDYRVLTCLLRYTSGLKAGRYTVEQRMLMLDFKLMQVWFGLTCRYVPPQARRSLRERSCILSHFASTMGQRSAALSRA